MDVAFSAPADRLSDARIERSTMGVDEVTYRCGRCSSPNRLTFATIDGLVEAALHASLPGAAIDDEAARAFEQGSPVAPGRRAIEGACVSCGRRYRLVCEGGEQSREGALEYRFVEVGEETRVPRGGSPVARGIAWLVVLGFVLGAVFVGRSGLDAERERSELIADGRTATAGIVSESTRRRSSATIRIAYPTEGTRVVTTSMTLPLLSGWHTGDRDIEVRYLPSDEDVVRPAATYQRHAWEQWLGVVLLLVPAVLLGRALVRTGRSRR